MDRIDDDYDRSDLPDRFKLALRLADAVITDPAGLSPADRTALTREFTPAELVELALTVAMAAGFSKAAIAWGPPPPFR